MGIITVLLYSTGYLHGEFHVPHWVAISCYIAIGLGTLTGGWRIIETMGTRITKLSQHQGFSASTGGSVMLFAASWLGIPVSTTHTITGCVIGAGVARRASAVRWGVARNVVIAWVITIPASAAVGGAVLLADDFLLEIVVLLLFSGTKHIHRLFHEAGLGASHRWEPDRRNAD